MYTSSFPCTCQNQCLQKKLHQIKIKLQEPKNAKKWKSQVAEFFSKMNVTLGCACNVDLLSGFLKNKSSSVWKGLKPGSRDNNACLFLKPKSQRQYLFTIFLQFNPEQYLTYNTYLNYILGLYCSVFFSYWRIASRGCVNGHWLLNQFSCQPGNRKHPTPLFPGNIPLDPFKWANAWRISLAS